MSQRVFTKEILKSCNTMAATMGYNRVADDKFLDTLDDDKFYIPRFTMTHEHKAGEACEPHVRCMFDTNQGTFFIDVEMGCWELVPTAEKLLRDLGHEVHETTGA